VPARGHSCPQQWKAGTVFGFSQAAIIWALLVNHAGATPAFIAASAIVLQISEREMVPSNASLAADASFTCDNPAAYLRNKVASVLWA
jgi:hypothetical protein